MSDIPLEDETRSVEEIIAAANNVINSWSPQFTADEVLAVAKELDAARAKLTAIAGLEDALVPDSDDGPWIVRPDARLRRGAGDLG